MIPVCSNIPALLQGPWRSPVFSWKRVLTFGSIIDNSFYKKTYVQNQIMGRALLESITFLDGKAIFSALRQSDLDFTV